MSRLTAILTKPLFWGILALIAFALNGVPWLYPGEGTRLLDALLATPLPQDLPFAATLPAVLLRWTAPWMTPALMTLLTAAAGAACVGILAAVARRFVTLTAVEPRTQAVLPAARGAAAAAAALGLMLSPLFFSAATHFQWQTFEMLLLLLAVNAVLKLWEVPSRLLRWALGYLLGLLLLSSPMTLLLVPVLAVAAVASDILSAKTFRLLRPLLRFALSGLAGLLTVLLGAMLLAGSWSPAVALRILALRVYGLSAFVSVGPWILTGFFVFCPVLLALLALPRIYANRRNFPILFAYAACAVLALIGVLPIAASPFRTVKAWGECYPLLFSVSAAFSLSMLAAAGLCLIRVRRPAEGADEVPLMRRIGGLLGWVLPLPVLLAAIGCGILGIARQQAAELPLLRTVKSVAQTLVADLPDGAWLLGDGAFDPYIRLLLREMRERQITFVPFAQTEDPAMLESLRAKVRSQEFFAQDPALPDALLRALDIGFYPFAQDWIAKDPRACTMLATVAYPDLWYSGNAIPSPDGLIFRGSPTLQALREDLTAEPDRRCPTLPSAYAALDDAETAALQPAVTAWRELVRRQHSFILNNLGFYLTGFDRREEAYRLFREAYTAFPGNVSALFNCFTLISDGLHPEDKAWCEAQLQPYTRKPLRIWTLSRSYGYIYNPQMMAALIGEWVMSGQTGAALTGMDIVMEMLDDNSRDAFRQALAALYSTAPGKRRESIARYRELLAQSTDAERSVAYIRELIRLSLQENDLETVQDLIAKADTVARHPADFAYEKALLFAAAGDQAKARLHLQTYLERYPKSLEANTMLAILQLQAGELDELRSRTLPKLTLAAGTRDNYFVQITLAQLAEREGNLDEARTAYLNAYRLNPEVTVLRNTVLSLDIRLNDRSAAARHAREYLLRDRMHPLSNYVIGSIALNDGDLERAARYLTVATDPAADPPLPEAFNDLAETYRRMARWTDALTAAQQACRLAPKLAIAYETAAASLLGLGRFGEAEAELDRAEAIHRELLPNAPLDPRILITRARVQAATARPELARTTLAEARKQYDTLDAGAKAEYEALAETLGMPNP